MIEYFKNQIENNNASVKKYKRLFCVFNMTSLILAFDEEDFDYFFEGASIIGFNGLMPRVQLKFSESFILKSGKNVNLF